MATKKITKSLLENLQKSFSQKAEIEKNITQVSINIATYQKSLYKAMDEMEKINDKITTLRNKLQEKYGDNVKVDLSNGNIVEE
jgi:hypothetical protein